MELKKSKHPSTKLTAELMFNYFNLTILYHILYYTYIGKKRSDRLRSVNQKRVCLGCRDIQSKA